MTNLIIGIIIIVVTNILTAIVCLFTAKSVIHDQEEVFDTLISRRDREIEQLRHYINNNDLKFNED